jgi:hypothetical protein
MDIIKEKEVAKEMCGIVCVPGQIEQYESL